MGAIGILAKVTVGVVIAKNIKTSSGKTMLSESVDALENRQDLSDQSAYSQKENGNTDEIIYLLSGGRGRGTYSSGGLGGILEAPFSKKHTSHTQHINSMLDGLARQLQVNAGSSSLATLLASLAHMAQRTTDTAKNKESFGRIFNQAIARKAQIASRPSADQEAVASLMLVAMIQASKVTGKLDKQRLSEITKEMGGLSKQEELLLQEILKAPLDIEALVEATPPNLKEQVYIMSVLALSLESNGEALYLHKLSQAFGLSYNTVNQIHDRLGMPRISNLV